MPSSDQLAVVCCHFNPCHYRSRLDNFFRFHEHVQDPTVYLLTVELAFDDDAFEIHDLGTEVARFRSGSVLWQKERLINWGLRELRSRGFERLCHLDADVLFSNDDWAERVLERLDSHNLVQVFETASRYGCSLPGAARCLYDDPPAVAERRFGLGWALRAELLDQASLYEGLVSGGADRLMFLTALLHPRCLRDYFRGRREDEPAVTEKAGEEGDDRRQERHRSPQGR